MSLRKLVAGVVVVASLGAASSAGAGAPARVQVGAAPRVPHGAKALGKISSNASITGAVVLAAA